MRVVNTILVAEPITTWVESSERNKGMVEIVDHYEIRKVYGNLTNARFFIERDGKFSLIEPEKVIEYECNLSKYFK